MKHKIISWDDEARPIWPVKMFVDRDLCRGFVAMLDTGYSIEAIANCVMELSWYATYDPEDEKLPRKQRVEELQNWFNRNGEGRMMEEQVDYRAKGGFRRRRHFRRHALERYEVKSLEKPIMVGSPGMPASWIVA